VIPASPPRFRSSLCEGFVTHRRVEGPRHAFRYRVLMTLLDLDEIPDLDRSLRLFGHDRPRPLSFRDRDHLGGSGRGVRAELEGLVRAEGLGMPAGRILLLTNCRVLGYVFNPVSFFYCHDAGDRLALVVAEVELPPPGSRVEATIDLTRSGATRIATHLALEARPMSDRAILSALVRFPFQTLKVIAAIHWEALLLWGKGAPFFPRPPYDPAAAERGPA